MDEESKIRMEVIPLPQTIKVSWFETYDRTIELYSDLIHKTLMRNPRRVEAHMAFQATLAGLYWKIRSSLTDAEKKKMPDMEDYARLRKPVNIDKLVKCFIELQMALKRIGLLKIEKRTYDPGESMA